MKQKEGEGWFLITLLLLLLLSLGHTVQPVGSYFPDQGSDLCPLHCQCGVLTTGSPGKSQEEILKIDNTDFVLTSMFYISHLI